MTEGSLKLRTEETGPDAAGRACTRGQSSTGPGVDPPALGLALGLQLLWPTPQGYGSRTAPHPAQTWVPRAKGAKETAQGSSPGACCLATGTQPPGQRLRWTQDRTGGGSETGGGAQPPPWPMHQACASHPCLASQAGPI